MSRRSKYPQEVRERARLSLQMMSPTPGESEQVDAASSFHLNHQGEVIAWGVFLREHVT